MSLMILYLSLTLVVYILSKKLYRRTQHMLCSPLIICPIVLLGILVTFQIPYDNYAKGGKWLSLMLQPATGALAVPLYKYRATVKKHLTEILVGVTGGAAVAIVTSLLIGRYMGADLQLMASMAPRSVTVPMAMSISEIVGGNPSLTAVFVILTGITGTLFVTFMLKYGTVFKSPITKGMLYGITAHGTGTAKAFEAGEMEGAISSLAMIFMGIVTTLIAPEIVNICFSLLNV